MTSSNKPSARPAPGRSRRTRPKVGRRRAAPRWLLVVLICLSAAGLGAFVPSPAAAETPTSWSLPDGVGSGTISQTTGLGYQSVELKWSGFQPTVSFGGLPQDDAHTVWIMQCRGATPQQQDCRLAGPGLVGVYRNSAPQLVDSSGAFVDELTLGPTNALHAITGPDGSGRVTFEVRPKTQEPVLGCDASPDGAPTCSLVIVPGYTSGSAALEEPNWSLRAVIPLAFRAGASSCQVANPDAVMEGSYAAQRAFESWQGTLCSQQNRVDAVYLAAGEAAARQDFGVGISDGALTLRPFASAAPRAATYAPAAVSSIGIGFVVDDPFTGQQLTRLRLNARMVAKVMTQSYGVAVDNPATPGNPLNFGDDPELQALNPGLPLSLQTPALVSGDTDLIYELTRWIDSDPAARAFLDGAPDPYSGMRVNAHYRGMVLPISQLDQRDDWTALNVDCRYQVVQDAYPLSSPSVIAGSIVTATGLSRNPPVPSDTSPCSQSRPDQGAAPNRAVLGLVDSGQAAALRIPMAELLGPRGTYVKPDLLGMQAALSTMAVNPDGVTRQVDYKKLPPNGYPLTVMTSLAVPTVGLSTGADGRAEKVGRVLDHIAGAGQLLGIGVGDLPDGYVPLSQSLRDLTVKAAADVRNQVGTPPPAPTVPPTTPAPTVAPTTPAAPAPLGSLLNVGSSGAGSGSGSTSGSGGSDGSGGSAGGGTSDGLGSTAPTPTLPAGAPAPAAVTPAPSAVPVAQRRAAATAASQLRWALPVLLLLAAGGGLAGRLMSQAGQPGALLPAVSGRVSAVFGRLPSALGRLPSVLGRLKASLRRTP